MDPWLLPPQQRAAQQAAQAAMRPPGVPAAPPPLAAAAPPLAFSEEEQEEEPPPPPTQVVVDRPPDQLMLMESATDAVSLQWAPVVCTVHSPPGSMPLPVEYTVHYELQMQQVDDKGGLHPERWSVQYLGAASFVQVKGLRPGRCYAARATALPHVTSVHPGLEVVVVPSPPSDTLLVNTLPCPPMGQPSPQLASRLKKELKFKWAEPEETGGRPLQYELEMSPAPEGWEGGPPTPEGFFPVYSGAERSYVAKRLLPGVQYCARVKAINCEGESAWSPLLVCYTQATVPSWAPSDTPFVWDTTSSSVTLGWPEPASNGGNVVGYEVEMDDGSGFRHVARSDERQCTVEGLRSGILYKFRVRAENEAGRSLWSPLGEGRTAAVAPSACGAPTVLGVSKTSLTVRWEGPEDDGGTPVASFQVQLRPRCSAARRGIPDADEWLVVYHGPEQACTIGGLRPGCSYMARVAAVSRAGTGTHSAATILQTSPSTPECPGAPAVMARQQTELSVTWHAPEHDGGTPLTAYRLEMSCLGSSDSGGGGSGSKGKGKLDALFELAYLGPEHSTVVSGLEPGHRYSLRCSAINAQGSSGWGPVAQAETLPGLPYPVDSLTLGAATANTIKLRWSAPYGRGAPVTSYAVEVAEAAALAQQQATAQAAAQQQQLEAEQGADQEAGGSQGLGGRDDEAVAALDALFRPVYQGHDCHCSVGGLEPHTAYCFRVRALNAMGSSLSDVESFRTTPAPPASPLDLHLQEGTPSCLHLSWVPPRADHGAAVSGYQVECARVVRGATAAAVAWKGAYQGIDLHAQVEGLEAGSRYLVRARASNACGWGPWSEQLACATSPDVPAAPGGLSTKAVGTTVRVVWEAAEDRGAPVEAYELEAAGGSKKARGDFALVYRGDASSFKLQQLDASASYHLRVRAVNAVGAGPYSPAVMVQTCKAPPSAPTDVQAAAAAGSGGAIEVSWAAAAQGAQQAACVSYEVEATEAAERRPVSVRQPCPTRATTVQLAVPKGGAYRVRVRAVGADSAGHGEWSEAATVTVQAPAPPAAAAASASEPSPKTQKRRERRGGDGEGGQQQRGSGIVAAAKSTAAAKVVRRRGWQDRQIGGLRLGTLVGVFKYVLLAFVVLVMFALMVREGMHDAAATRYPKTRQT